jgi:predicted RNA-binding Zn ribbon-like protein
MPNHDRPDPKPFELVAGHVALDLVNTLDNRFSEAGPEELLASYEDLLRFATQSELLTERQVKKLKRAEATPAERALVLGEVRELREALAEVAYAQFEEREISAASLALLEARFKQAAQHRCLSAEQSQIAWSWRGLGRQVAAPLWLLAQAATELLLSNQVAQLRLCASDTCRWLFLDTSKNHTRRWCDMKVCGNRMKARRFHARRSESYPAS